MNIELLEEQHEANPCSMYLKITHVRLALWSRWRFCFIFFFFIFIRSKARTIHLKLVYILVHRYD